jgi:hypothetical protein
MTNADQRDSRLREATSERRFIAGEICIKTEQAK